jgi:molybdopterin synthase sulfur carrier subunit
LAVTVVFLGRLRDLAGCESTEMGAPLDWAGLLAAVGADLAAEIGGARLNVACNGVVLADKTALQANDGDEVALLPPVSGG